MDVGCGSGEFLETMKEHFQVQGLEINEEAAKFSRANGFKVHSSPFISLPIQNQYDVISFVDVLEHLPQPKEHLLKAHQLLKEEGMIFIKVPNYPMQLKKQLYFQKRNKTSLVIMYDFAHINHFTPESLSKVLLQAGFEVVDLSFSQPIIDLPKKGLKRYLSYRIGTSLANTISKISGKNLSFNFSVLAKKRN